VVQRYCRDEDSGGITTPAMFVYRLAGGLFPVSLRVRKCAVGMLTWEIDYEHIGEQPHRTDLQAIEATSKKHNVLKQGEYKLFIANNEGYKAELDQMADRYAQHVRTMIANHSTWDVPTWAKATHVGTRHGRKRHTETRMP
jgi:hypothetical protein